MLRRVLVASSVSVLLVWSLPAAAATVPPALTEQGRLLSATNTPITTTQSMVFAIYNSPTAGTPATALWTETQTITPDNGYFSAELGAVTTLPATLFSGQTLYLGLSVGGDTEMTPRQPMTSVPYAFTAQNVIGDITPTSVSIVTASGPVAVIDNTGKWVGAGSGLAGPTGPTGPTLPVGVANGLASLNASAQVNASQLPYNVANGIAEADSTGRTPAASARNGLISVTSLAQTAVTASQIDTAQPIPGLLKSLTVAKGDVLVCTFSGQFFGSTDNVSSGGVAAIYVADNGVAAPGVVLTGSQMPAIYVANGTVPAAPVQSTTAIWTVTAAGTTTIQGMFFANGGAGITFGQASGLPPGANEGTGNLTILQFRP